MGHSQQRLQLRFHDFSVFKPDDFLAKNSLAIIEQRGRKAFDAAKLVLDVVGGDGERITDAHLLREQERVLAVPHGVKLESDYNETALAVAFEQLLIARHLFLARLAPRGPKINQDHLSPQAD